MAGGEGGVAGGQCTALSMGWGGWGPSSAVMGASSSIMQFVSSLIERAVSQICAR
jgi:hypothetical protein